MDLSEQFNRFAGKEVQVIETERQTKYGPVRHAELGPNNPVIAELRDAVREAGLTLRLWLPGMAGTADCRPDRLNVHVDKEADGKFRIGPNFKLG